MHFPNQRTVKQLAEVVDLATLGSSEQVACLCNAGEDLIERWSLTPDQAQGLAVGLLGHVPNVTRWVEDRADRVTISRTRSVAPTEFIALRIDIGGQDLHRLPRNRQCGDYVSRFEKLMDVVEVTSRLPQGLAVALSG
jgi:hypothetical protein